jgi:hypothetical protein
MCSEGKAVLTERNEQTQQRELPSTLFAVILADPLSEVTRKERLYLLGVSTIAVVIKLTGLVPTEISALGIKFEKANQETLLFYLGLVVLYFLGAFVLYGTSDLLAWLEKYRFARASVEQPALERYQQLAVERDRIGLSEGSSVTPSREDEIAFQAKKKIAEEYLRDLEKSRRPAVIIGGFRAIFEYLLPVLVGTYALVVLW